MQVASARLDHLHDWQTTVHFLGHELKQRTRDGEEVSGAARGLASAEILEQTSGYLHALLRSGGRFITDHSMTAFCSI